MRPTTLLIISSVFASGCGIQRPDTDLCIINAVLKQRKCFNMRRDYNDDGRLKLGAKAHYKPAATIDDVNKNLSVDPDGLANLKVYIQELRAAANE